MEDKFFAEIEKKMNIKTIKDFEKEVRKKIYDELEKLRKKNKNISTTMIESESQMFVRLLAENSLEVTNNKKLSRLIEIYLQFASIIGTVKILNEKVDEIKKFKEQPVDSE